ncbi:H/ACA ribonucleoprotein complex non-core subunit NAF1 [Pectinophora gossypiella]|uniref:H/ACA ribonucleoprotein complex non-core subunit NAF1 n=1 Tax=Pectinophora gossypiella TaxID=13191 RepID=UPI00214F40C3|nr:H/ACA ribonucleoprotein complex non-core subunit NAF1 [Pectinophora gossypiella]
MENLDQGNNNKNVSLSLIAEYGASDSDSDDTESHSNDNTGNEDSDAAELSEMVLKNNIINACAHGPLARSTDAETTRHMIIDSAESGVVEYDVTEYRDEDSESDSSDSDVDSVKDIEEISSGEEESSKSSKAEPPKVHGELGLDDLPPIEDLAISLPEQETTKIGTVASIVDRLVIVRAFPNTPAVDLESVLFVDSGAKALGKVFDVFGPVTEPHYCVRFNSAEHVRARGVEVGVDVYIAPRHDAHTNYVFLTELMKLKGSDASWLHDIEAPPQHIDFSDDEEERKANRAKREAQWQKQEESDGETSKNPARKTQETRRSQRPSESSSRFGSGPSRARNPFSAGSRRNPNSFTRFNRPWGNFDMRTPPPHPDPFSAPPNFNGPPMFPPPFNPNTPPPFMGNTFQFGGNPRMGPMPPNMPPFRQSVPIFGSNFCNGQPPQWVNNGPPPPPGT